MIVTIFRYNGWMKHDFQQFIDDALAGTPSVTQTPEYEIHHAPIQEHFDRGQMLRRLDTRPAGERDKPNSLHIGVAGFHNFEVVGRTRPENILLLDVNPAQERFWRTVVRLLQKHETPEAFSEAFHDLRIEGSIHCFDDAHVTETETTDIEGYMHGASWLNDPEQYRYLHRMACEGKIAATTIDLLKDFKRAEVLGDALKEKGLKADTCYWANINSFFRPHRAGSFLSRNDTTFGEGPRGAYPTDTLVYPIYAYRVDRAEKTNQFWTDEQMQHAKIHQPETLPPAEQFLRIISAIGGEHGEHYMLETKAKPYRQMLVYDGPPARLPAKERSWRERMQQVEGPDAPLVFK